MEPQKKKLDTAIAENGKPLPPWTIHDIRRTVATGMADIGIQPHIIEAVLNHVSGHKGGIAGVYNRSNDAAEKAAALARWDEHVASIVGAYDEGAKGGGMWGAVIPAPRLCRGHTLQALSGRVCGYGFVGRP